MKYLFSIVCLLAYQSSFGACVDHWGHKMQIRQINSSTIALRFDTWLYPASGYLKYNGSRSTSHYFRGNGRLAEIEKSVFTTGQGRVWYRYPAEAGSHEGDKLASFTCR